jgi:hypothetical protein
MTPKKVYFQEGLKPSKVLGFARPQETITDAKVLEVRTGTKNKNYAFFILATEDKTTLWQSAVAELMGLDQSPVKIEDNKPFIEPEGLFVTIPADRGQPISFRYSK